MSDRGLSVEGIDEYLWGQQGHGLFVDRKKGHARPQVGVLEVSPMKSTNGCDPARRQRNPTMHQADDGEQRHGAKLVLAD